MLKRTLFFTNPFNLSVKDSQLIIQSKEKQVLQTVPIEDIGFIVLDHNQLSISIPLIQELIANNVAVVYCDPKHHPNAMLLNLDGHHLQGEIFRQQVETSEPLKKNLWKQTIEAKIKNQAGLLKLLNKEYRNIESLAKYVKSGDPENREGTAARIYWPRLFGKTFTRDRYGAPPNDMLNYSYTVLRASVARALIGSGLLPTLGIHHHGRYNAFCLADDIMEPFRPFVDKKVYEVFYKNMDNHELSKEIKAELLQVLTTDIFFKKMVRPLMVGLSLTTASLARCFTGESKKIVYPIVK